MITRIISAIFLASMVSQTFAASCSNIRFTRPSELKLKGDKLLIVTHPSTLWDGRFSSKAGMDAAVAFAKAHRFQSIYLAGEDSKDTYFFADCDPSYWVSSYGGEFSFSVTANHIYSVGGHWELCQATTQRDLFTNNWKLNRRENYTFTQVMEGLYMYGQHVQTSDPYYDEFSRFLEIVTYRNPRDPWYIKKLSLIEMMGIIKTPELQIEYLRRNLPPYQNLPPEFEVQLVVNGQLIEILRKSSITKNPPIMTLEFIDNLYSAGTIPSK
jgi:hypothetical protein